VELIPKTAQATGSPQPVRLLQHSNIAQKANRQHCQLLGIVFTFNPSISC